jgi:DNA helicase II / ATP-dependent DNA helicase PcrA
VFSHLFSERNSAILGSMAVARNASVVSPDPQQQPAIEHVSGPMLVVAGAGTGKTTVLIHRIARLIREGHARPDEILALTYTENAAREMLERVQRELRGSNIEGLQVLTFHAYCNNLLIAMGRNFGVLDDKQLWIYLRRNLRELRLKYFVRAAKVSEFLDDLLDFIRRCHDELATPEDYRNYVHRIERGELSLPRVTRSKKAAEISDEESLGRCREIASVFETVERLLRERNFGTFGHMILRANDLLAADPALLDRARCRARFILVDEFQDANFAQIKVLEKLAGTERNVFAVGDPDQGIYRFRGASSGAFELFQKHFPDSKLVVLAKNRRSTTPVLKCAHALIAQNPEFALQAGAVLYRRSPLVSVRDEAQPVVPRPPVEAVVVTNNLIEATDLVDVLRQLKKRSRCTWKDFGILYRSHANREDVAAELARSGIPFSIEGLDVLDTPEVRDLLACLGGVVVSSDSVSMLRVAALPPFDVDPEELRTAMRALPRDGKGSMASVLPQVKGGVSLLGAVEQARAAVAGMKIHATLLTLTRHFQIRRSPVIQALLEFATQWEKSPLTESGSPAEFLEYFDYFREARGTIPLPSSNEDNSVRLMSAHAAKGLEFDHVFILRAVSGTFPCGYHEPLIEIPDELRKSGLATDRDEKEVNKQEERRLFYVAMTRARDTLSIYGKVGRGKAEKTPPGYMRELSKDKTLKSVLKLRNSREFQAEIFAAAAPCSRLAEWIALPPRGDLAATLSASAIDNYKICPLRFKLDREWRIPGEVSAALQYGASMHRVLRTYFDSVRFGRPKSEDELIQMFREDLAAEAISDRYQHDLYEKQGIAQLSEFLVAAQQGAAEVLHTEESFSIKVGETTLLGRIDRIDRAGADRVAIVDYKTGKPKSQEDADESLQLSLYALAAREKWGYRPERLVFYNLDENSAISTERSEIKLEEARLEVAHIADEIAAGNFNPKVGFHCYSCAYRTLCPKTEKRIPEAAALAADQVN